MKPPVDEIDELAHVPVLPAGAALVHRVAKGESRIGIREPQRAAGAEVSEGARVRAQTSLGLREPESEPEACGP
jgi:hypothetical protein